MMQVAHPGELQERTHFASRRLTMSPACMCYGSTGIYVGFQYGSVHRFSHDLQIENLCSTGPSPVQAIIHHNEALVFLCANGTAVVRTERSGFIFDLCSRFQPDAVPWTTYGPKIIIMPYWAQYTIDAVNSTVTVAGEHCRRSGSHCGLTTACLVSSCGRYALVGDCTGSVAKVTI